MPKLSRGDVPTACGLLGAVVMPHNLYLHSALVQSGRMLPGEVQRCRRERLLYHNIEGGLALAGGGTRGGGAVEPAWERVVGPACLADWAARPVWAACMGGAAGLPLWTAHLCNPSPHKVHLPPA